MVIHIFIFTGGKYLIAGGNVNGASNEMTEVVEYLEIETTSTPSFGELPSVRGGAVGFMFDDTPIICGGYGLDDCISYQDSQWSKTHLMVWKRKYAAGIQINSTTFWILGGFNYGNPSLDSTEFIIQGQTNGVPGPKLPYGKNGVCAVKLSEHEIFVIGGHPNKRDVWIYDPQNGFTRTQGPSLNKGRYQHSCSTMRDGEKTVIIAAGGWNNGDLDSVEIYDPTDNTWHSGKTKFSTTKNTS